MAQALFRTAAIPHRLMPAALALGTSTFTMSALPGTPAIQNAIPMPFFGTTPFAAPGLGMIATAIMLGFGLWCYGVPKPPPTIRERVMEVARASKTMPSKAPRKMRSFAGAQR
jgi:H+/gluconate symporter-like permease